MKTCPTDEEDKIVDEDIVEEVVIRKVIDVVEVNQLQSINPSRDEFKRKMSDYFKVILSKLTESAASKETIDKFKGDAMNFLKKFMEDFGGYEFYTGSSENPGIIIPMKCQEEGDFLFYYFQTGLIEETDTQS